MNDNTQKEMATQIIPRDWSHQTLVAETVLRAPSNLMIALCAAVAIIVSMLLRSKIGVKAPYAGYRSILEPAILVRMRFSRKAQPQINEGYQKFKNSMFKVSRNDKDLLVIPNKYMDELKNIPEDKLSLIHALVENIVGRYTASEILLNGNLHTRILYTKLPSHLAELTAVMKKIIDEAIVELHEQYTDDWAKVNIYKLLSKLINRISNRVLLGEIDSLNEEWRKASFEFSKNVRMTLVVMRAIPVWIRPLAAIFVPSVGRVSSSLRAAQEALVPIIHRRREAEKNTDYAKPDDFLQWMMDAAEGDEGSPEKLAHHLLLMVLASVHTTTMTGGHAFFDLCAHPELFDPLRAEISEVAEREGDWSTTTLAKLRRVDSFLKESQRMSPTSLLSFHRIVQEPITLSDGIHLPASTHLCVASEAISKDPDFAPNANEFDGLRYFKKRQYNGEANKHQFASIDKWHLHFGQGKYACPGRFFASNELKLILARLITEFDFRYPEGQGRPASLNIDEFLYSDPATTMLIRIHKVAAK